MEWRLRGIGGRTSGEGDEEEDISREEFDRVIKKLKIGKSTGGDDTVNEVWKFGGEEVRK